MLTAHNQRGTMAITPWPGAAWLTVNDVYDAGTVIYELSQTADQQAPPLPFFMIEGDYENEHSTTPQQLRAEAYWPVLSGGFGYIFGNCPIWSYGFAPSFCSGPVPDWKTALDYPGSVSMMYAQQLFTSRAWQDLVPDFAHTKSAR